MKKKILSMGLCAALTASLFAGCGANGGTATSTETVDTSGELTWRLGGIGPITGGAAQYGQGVMNAIQIAVDEVNEAGGINGYKVSFNFQDDETDPQKAVNAYNTLKDWGMQILEGTVTSGACAAVSAETYNDRIFQLTPSASSTDVTTGHDNTFQVCFSDPNQGTVSADYIADNGLATKVGIIYDSSDAYSTGIYQTFSVEAEAKGLEVVAAEAFTSDSKTDFTTQLQKCKDAGAELLFLPFYYTEGSIVPFAADADDEATQSFVSKYQEAYGGTPNQFAADAYDGVYILKEALEAADLTPEASNEEICEALISAIQNVTYNGLTGENMTWNAAGEVSKDPKAVIIENGAYVSVQ